MSLMLVHLPKGLWGVCTRMGCSLAVKTGKARGAFSSRLARGDGESKWGRAQEAGKSGLQQKPCEQ
jgi:hypothetical protein